MSNENSPPPNDDEPGRAGPRSYVDPSVVAEAEAEDGRLQAENADLKDRLLRTLADMENLRRRTEREVKDAGTYAVTRFAREMLGVADNLRRAIEATPADARADGPAKALVEGVELTERTLLQALERFNVKPIAAKGARFDPNLHQAVFEMPDPSAAPGTVVQVMQDGFTIGERVLRPALVGIAKGAAKPADGVPGEGVDRSV